MELNDSDIYGIDREGSVLWTDTYIGNPSEGNLMLINKKFFRWFVKAWDKRESIYMQNKRYRMFRNIRRSIWLFKRKIKLWIIR